MGEAGLEPAKAKPADLQSAPFAARDIPPPRDKPSTKKPRADAGPIRCALMVTARSPVNPKSPDERLFAPRPRAALRHRLFSDKQS